MRLSRLALPALVACLAMAVTSCSDMPRLGPRSTPPKDLGFGQVTEYEGRDLSSIDDFRENSIKGPQSVDQTSYRLSIEGLVNRPVKLTYADVVAGPNYKKVVRLDCVEGWGVDILWEGVLVSELIDRAGPKPQADTVIFRAVDGYSTALPLDYLRENEILLAHRMNGLVLPEERGFPFQLVAEDKWGYKWIKWVEEIELSDDPSYRGYWEQRGYSNTGDIKDDPFKK